MKARQPNNQNNMTTLEERREAYLAVHDVIIGLSPIDAAGVCDHLGDYLVYMKEFSLLCAYTVGKDFPEFASLKPQHEHGLFWWRMTEAGKRKRIEALQKAYELTFKK